CAIASPIPCVEPVTSATLPESLMIVASFVERGPRLHRAGQPIRVLDLNFDERRRVLTAVHHVVCDAGGAHVAVTRGEAELRDLLAIVDAHPPIGQQHDKIGPAVLMPTCNSAWGEVPTRHANDVVVLQDRGDRRNIALERHIVDTPYHPRLRALALRCESAATDRGKWRL